MYIEKLVIEGFGRIQNLSLNLKKGLNLIYGNNESGKTTIQWFVKGMLFGLKGGRTSKEGILPPIKRFKPWSGSVFGGKAEYRLDNGKAYRVERDFANSLVKVFDNMLNDITDSYSTGKSRKVQFAESQLGLSETCFDKTAFIRQMESKVEEDGSRELINRLINVSQTGFEDVSFKRAEKALKDALKKYVGTEKTSTRPLDKVNERLNALKKVKDDLKSKRESLLSVEGELVDAENKKRYLESRKLLLEEIKKLIDIKQEVERDKRTARNLEKKLTKIEEKDALIKKLSQGFEDYADQYTAEGKRETGTDSSWGRVLNYALGISVAAFTVFTAAGFVHSGAFFKGAAAAFLVALILAVLKASVKRTRFFKKRRVSPSEIKKDLQDKASKLMILKDELKDLLSQASADCGTYIRDYNHIKEVASEYTRKVSVMEQNLDTYVDKLESEYKKGNTLSDEELINIIVNLKMDLSREDLDRMEKLWQYDYDSTCSSLEGLTLKIKECQILLQNSPDNEEIQRVQEEIGELEEKREELLELSLALETAAEVLEDAAKEIQRDYIPRLNSEMGRIISKITDGRYTDLRTDDKLCLKTVAPETGSVRTSVNLSGGTIDQMYFALRVAAVKLIERDGEKLPLIMDEPFSQYDDDRMTKAFYYLKELARDRQVIFFTCKSREVEVAREVFGDFLNYIELSN